jgi:hypothetical protein
MLPFYQHLCYNYHFFYFGAGLGFVHFAPIFARKRVFDAQPHRELPRHKLNAVRKMPLKRKHFGQWLKPMSASGIWSNTASV